MRTLRFGMIGAGFWAPYQLAGWSEVEGNECVAICDRDLARAESLANRFQVPAAYDDPAKMLDEAVVDFVDIVAAPPSHDELVRLAAARRKPVICQKPLTDSVAAAEGLIDACRAAGVPLLVNENFRWQTPLRAAKSELLRAAIGEVFRGRIDFVSSFPVFDNQPFLKRLERFILADVGVHILDVARFLFGEPSSVACRTFRANPSIRGEDVATVFLGYRGGVTVVCNLSYASRTRLEQFPQTFLFVEGTEGSLELTGDYWIHVTTADGTTSRQTPPPRYTWAHPKYEVVHASIVDCQRNLLDHLSGRGTAETTAADNIETLKLVEAAYESAASGNAVRIGDA